MRIKVDVLDHGHATFIESWGSDAGIVEAARMSTGKGFLGWGPVVTGIPCFPNGEPNGSERMALPGFLEEVWRANGCPEKQDATNPFLDVRETPGDEKLLRFLWDNRHATPFEMAGMTIEVKAPIMVFREWHRHRTQSYNEMSARYVPLPDENYVPSMGRMLAGGQSATNKQASGGAVSEVDALEWLAELADVYDHAQRVYESGIRRGIAKEIARLPVPVGRYSRMRASANLRNWLGFLTLRSTAKGPGAQWEIRQYADVVASFVAQSFPRTYELFAGDTP